MDRVVADGDDKSYGYVMKKSKPPRLSKEEIAYKSIFVPLQKHVSLEGFWTLQTIPQHIAAKFTDPQNYQEVHSNHQSHLSPYGTPY